MTDSLTPRLSVRAVVYDAQGRLLLAAHQGPRGPWYVLPGGGVDHNETLHEAVVREVLEETGLRVTPADVLFVREVMADRQVSSLPVGFHQVEVFVQCTPTGARAQATNPDPDQVGITWMPVDELCEHTVYPRDWLQELGSRHYTARYKPPRLKG